MDVLIVVDMQNDFIDGALGTAEAVSVVPRVTAKIKGFEGMIFATRDTHTEDYANTQEGRLLPVPHCIEGSSGHEIRPEITEQLADSEIIDKPSFGSVELYERLRALHEKSEIDSITLIGLCTDICVISNAMLLKAYLPEVPVKVDAACCAGVTPESHNRALDAMEACQIIIENR